MRLVAVAILSLFLVPAAGAASPRLLYTGDWSGTRQLYSADPARRSIAQLTFGHDPSCDPLVVPCGYVDVRPSPDGRHIAFESENDSSCSALFVARPDGSARHRLVQPDTYGCPTFTWSQDSRRLAYVVNRYPGPEVYIVDADGSHNRRLGYGEEPAWSPGGHMIAVLDNHELYVNLGGHWRLTATNVDEYAWAPNSKWIAIITRYPESQLELVRPDGSETRQLTNNPADAPTWSHDGRFIAYGDDHGLEVVDLEARTTRLVDERGQREHAWAPRTDLLAFDGRDGLSVIDAKSGTKRVLLSDHGPEIAWAPDSRSIAYFRYGIRIVTLSGNVRMAVETSGRAGGAIGSFAWIKPRGELRYRRVEARNAATISDNALTAPWPIEHIAAEGDHVFYVTCGHLFLWTPASRALVQEEPAASLTPRCSTPGHYLPFDIYDVALAGDRVAFGIRSGNMSQGWDLYQQPLADPTAAEEFAGGFGYAGCTLGPAGLGDLAGAGDLLLFSRWEEAIPDLPATCGIATKQRIYRIDATGCPCPQIAGSPGPLLPADVNADRVVAVGTNETEVLDSTGKLLLAMPVHATAAQLSGPHLVVVVQGQMRDYDAVTGALLHAWPLPDVPSGSPCASPHPWGCPTVQLELEDASRDLAAYVLNGYLHVMELTNGTDQTVAKSATTARFIETGLVYADGAELHLVTFDKLPCC
jgi:Tol biopolymer transport system component